ncbi:MAG: cytochrome c [Armatimonadetes bacterium]|nr:cytochrome c [Armatimonadota bacterium]
MTRCLVWLAIILLPVVILGGMWVARRDPTKPNWALPTQMATSPAYKAQSSNPVFVNQATMQTPVEGTLPRGAHAFHYAQTDADRKQAGKELANPFQPTPETLQRGQRVFQTFCLVCHGESGRGDGPIIPKFPNPPNFLSAQSRQLSDGEMFHTITLGRKKMASYAAQVPWDDRWRVILYIRSLQNQKGKP